MISKRYADKSIYIEYRWKELFAFGRDLFLEEWNRLTEHSLEGRTSKFKVKKYDYKPQPQGVGNVKNSEEEHNL